MSSFTNAGEQLLLDYGFTTAPVTRPTAWYVALHTADPTEAGNVGEVSGNGYARQAATFERTGSVIANTDDLAFGPNTDVAWGNVTHASVWTAVTGGTCLAKHALTEARDIDVDDDFTIDAGDLTLTID